MSFKEVSRAGLRKGVTIYDNLFHPGVMLNMSIIMFDKNMNIP